MKYEVMDMGGDRYALRDVATGQGVRDEHGCMLMYSSPAAARASVEHLWGGSWRAPEPTDVFAHLQTFGKPPVVYICGAGKHLKDGIARIPKDAFTIALNSVIRYRRKWNVHMCADQYAARFDWFPPPDKLPRGCIPVYATAVLDLAQREGKPHEYPQGYTFAPLPPVVIGRDLLAGRLQVGGSVAGCALRFAYEIGAKRAVFCGVDMHGRGHFDGAPIDPNRRLREQDAWEHTPCLQWICEFLSGEGLTITTLTETKLELPHEA